MKKQGVKIKTFHATNLNDISPNNLPSARDAQRVGGLFFPRQLIGQSVLLS